jgi:hypothetical protein
MDGAELSSNDFRRRKRHSVSMQSWFSVFARLVHFASNGDASLAEDVCHLGFAQARSVVFEGQAILLFVDVEAAQPVGIRKFAETVHLLEAERRLQLVGNFQECHGRDYSSTRPASP